ncbi:hypothetical protein O3P69_015094 [Scylla paramamosain]|uniref:Uncharacterized protein n=1 Tax=Scylla paramamosain TaxID=85552 RepID=A0AAW0T4C8_SCYPA
MARRAWATLRTRVARLRPQFPARRAGARSIVSVSAEPRPHVNHPATQPSHPGLRVARPAKTSRRTVRNFTEVLTCIDTDTASCDRTDEVQQTASGVGVEAWVLQGVVGQHRVAVQTVLDAGPGLRHAPATQQVSERRPARGTFSTVFGMHTALTGASYLPS